MHKIQDYHFHYFPQYHEEYKEVCPLVDGIMVIHDAQKRMQGFLKGLEEFRSVIPIGIELSINTNFSKINNMITSLKEQGYHVIASVHTYKDHSHFLDVLNTIQPLLNNIHHIGHPFHKEKTVLPDNIIEDFLMFCKKNSVIVELNERYSRSYNIQFYQRIKEELMFVYSTDAHCAKDIGVYKKLSKYNLL